MPAAHLTPPKPASANIAEVATGFIGALPADAWSQHVGELDLDAIIRDGTNVPVYLLSLLYAVQAYERGEKTVFSENPDLLAEAMAQREGVTRVVRNHLSQPKFQLPRSTLYGDPDAPRDPVGDVAAYFQSLHPGYRELARQVANCVEPMESDCRGTIVIPAALSQEANYLPRTLQSFATQTVDASNFEIFILGNFTPEHARRSAGNIKACLSLVSQARAAFPHLRIRHAPIELVGEGLRTIGFLRSIASDAVMLRHADRRTLDDHFLFRCDADTRGVRANYIRAFLTFFKANPNVDAVMGRMIWSPEGFAADPLLAVNQVLDQALDFYGRVAIGRGAWYGPNLVVRASAFARAGGYDPAHSLGEDTAFTTALRDVRKGSKNFIPIASGNAFTRLATSTRRVAQLFQFEHAASPDQWTHPETQFGVDNSSVRTRKESTAAIELRDTAALRRAIEDLVHKTVDLVNQQQWYGGNLSVDRRPLAGILGRMLGISYRPLSLNRIEITNLDGFIARHRKWSAAGAEEGWERELNRCTRELIPPLYSRPARIPIDDEVLPLTYASNAPLHDSRAILAASTATADSRDLWV